MRYHTVLLDADGTLLDFLKSEKKAVRAALESVGITPTEEMLSRYSRINAALWKQLERREITRKELLHVRFERLAEEFALDADPLAIARAYPLFLGTFGDRLAGADTFLRQLHGKARMYVVTNGIREIQLSRLQKSGWFSLFDGVFISEEIGFDKPDVRYFEHVAQAIPQFDRADTVMVGDSLSSDMQGGLNFGLDTCWFNPEGLPTPSDMALTKVATTFDDVFAFICGGKEA